MNRLNQSAICVTFGVHVLLASKESNYSELIAYWNSQLTQKKCFLERRVSGSSKFLPWASAMIRNIKGSSHSQVGGVH